MSISRSWKRRALVAVATIGIVSTVGSAVLPNQDPQLSQQSQAARAKTIEETNARSHANDLGDALNREKLRSAERRPPEASARRAVDSLLRRP